MPSASLLDTSRAIGDVLLPVVARGAILRRPRLMRLAERLQVDARALREVRRLRTRYAEGPVPLRIAGRIVALVTAPEDVQRVLAMTPEPFSAATTEKVGALRHFQPHAVLITDPPLRAPRRDLNEQALETHQPVHQHAARMRAVIHEELSQLIGTIGWTDFRAVWSRIVRRIVLGDSARDDTALTAELDRLRSAANWAEFAPRRPAVRRSFAARLDRYAEAAEPGSLIAMSPPADGLADQAPHWLFAFDAAGIAVWRALAVLATRPALSSGSRPRPGTRRLHRCSPSPVAPSRSHSGSGRPRSSSCASPAVRPNGADGRCPRAPSSPSSARSSTGTTKPSTSPTPSTLMSGSTAGPNATGRSSRSAPARPAALARTSSCSPPAAPSATSPTTTPSTSTREPANCSPTRCPRPSTTPPRA
ncbi:hypothetical protein HNR71_005542 [Kribbella sandramycini]|uniref:Cytochrome P450 n=1 Tax=Kribbella sandramycini TaxID=60450 RepID=A0A841SKN6_9ACTN|nr:hypothetical protein [Kribbella sandramycini]MBB6569905.1 hypothetical protein [Kribbella sandramycini]